MIQTRLHFRVRLSQALSECPAPADDLGPLDRAGDRDRLRSLVLRIFADGPRSRVTIWQKRRLSLWCALPAAARVGEPGGFYRGRIKSGSG